VHGRWISAGLHVVTSLWLIFVFTACRGGPHREITAEKPYAAYVGARYCVVADHLSAYGVYASSDDKRMSYVTLIPMRVGGSEFAFRRDVPKGTIVTIKSAWQPYMLLPASVYYLVSVDNADLAPGVPVRLQLDRGNEGIGADLNPAIYRMISESDANGRDSRESRADESDKPPLECTSRTMLSPRYEHST
jgi:hypothetical protein